MSSSTLLKGTALFLFTIVLFCIAILSVLLHHSLPKNLTYLQQGLVVLILCQSILFIWKKKKDWDYTIGEAFFDGSYFPYNLSLQELTQGGLICGAIGTGKTSLRLHILQFLLKNNVRIVDFDIKGDAPRFAHLGEKGKILLPGKNFSFNIFHCPTGYSNKDYAEILIRSFLELLPSDLNLSPPQQYLLTKSVYLTVEREGTPKDFFETIIMISVQEKETIENFQEVSAYSLIQKLNWMQTLLGDIFWSEQTNLTNEDWSNESLFFDFSQISDKVPISLLRFLIDIILTRIRVHLQYDTSFSTESEPKLVIFIDEGQLLMPRTNNQLKLSKLEETFTTLRYRGVSVFGTGVSAEMMSTVLLDAGFISHFQSHSKVWDLSFELPGDESSNIQRLPRHTCVLKTLRNQIPRSIKLEPFNLSQDNLELYSLRIDSQQLRRFPIVETFEMNSETIWRLRIRATFSDLSEMKAPRFNQIWRDGRHLLQQLWINEWHLDSDITLPEISKSLFKSLSNNGTFGRDTLVNQQRMTLFTLMQIVVLNYIINNEFNQRVNLLKQNYRKLLSIAEEYINEHLIPANNEIEGFGKINTFIKV
ncbi:MAG: hypothetical protein ACW98K_08905 [Candidatus Kariarchaeaceae archaeon]